MLKAIAANVVIALFDFRFSDFNCFSAIKALNLYFAALSLFTASRASPILAVRILYFFALSTIAASYHSLILIDLHTFCKRVKNNRLKARLLWNALHLHLNPKRIIDGVLG